MSKELMLYPAVLQSQKPTLIGQGDRETRVQGEKERKIQEKKFPLVAPSSDIPLPILIQETAAQVQLNPETRLMLARASQALADYYQDDEML